MHVEAQPTATGGETREEVSDSAAAATGGGAKARIGGNAEEKTGAAVRNRTGDPEKWPGSRGRRELRGVRPRGKGGEGITSSRKKGRSENKAIPKSKYEEDLFPGNHSSVWGSWYNREEEKWGYACCHQCVKNAYCLADQA